MDLTSCDFKSEAKLIEVLNMSIESDAAHHFPRGVNVSIRGSMNLNRGVKLIENIDQTMWVLSELKDKPKSQDRAFLRADFPSSSLAALKSKTRTKLACGIGSDLVCKLL